MSEQMKTLATACGEREEDLVLLHYGDITGTEHDKLRSHLDGCARCRSFLQELGTLLPLTRKADDPPPDFWADYNRELRQKLDGSARPPGWRRALAGVFQWRPVPVFATAALVALALTLTAGKGLWRADDPARDQAGLLQVMPVAENLDFFTAMDVLDDMELLEVMGSQGGA